MYCLTKNNQRLDLVEGSTPSKLKKKTVVREGAGNVKEPAPTTTGSKRGDFIWVLLGASAHKEGAVATVRERSSQPGKNPEPERKRRSKRSLGRKEW
jgi:hypothetical protein